MIERSIYLHSSPSSWPHFSWACSRKNSCFETLSLKSQTFGGNNQQLLNINLQFVLRPVFHTWTRGTGCQGGRRGSRGRPSCSPSPPPSSCKPPGQGARWVETSKKRLHLHLFCINKTSRLLRQVLALLLLIVGLNLHDEDGNGDWSQIHILTTKYIFWSSAFWVSHFLDQLGAKKLAVVDDQLDEVGEVSDMVCWLVSHLGSRPGGEGGGRRKQLWIRTLQSSSPPPTPTIKKVISERN